MQERPLVLYVYTVVEVGEGYGDANSRLDIFHTPTYLVQKNAFLKMIRYLLFLRL